ncbi:vacuolar segregation subunit 7-domain-containing protein [Lipomyces oligophaga]|uniref:vacuolar segregation subunit 7-domain-containing protein n=1 Tax=Lipomyces oligophaga TaxID=45792 RepID=UPI0034CE4E2E
MNRSTSPSPSTTSNSSSRTSSSEISVESNSSTASTLTIRASSGGGGGRAGIEVADSGRIGPMSPPSRPAVGSRHASTATISTEEGTVRRNARRKRHNHAGHPESESDGGYRSDEVPASVSRLFTGTPLASGSVKRQMPAAHDGGKSAMTVETETVATVPTAVVGAVSSSSSTMMMMSAGSSVRSGKNSSVKNSVKSSRKRKPRPLPLQANAPSRADIFEAKVASAVDDHDSDDSDEVFVYGSTNPRNPSESVAQIIKSSRSPSVISVSGRTMSDVLEQARAGQSSGPSSQINSLLSPEPRAFTTAAGYLYGSTKGLMIPPPSPRPFVSRGAASAMGIDNYPDDESEDDGTIDIDDDDLESIDESAPMLGGSNGRRLNSRQRLKARMRRNQAHAGGNGLTGSGIGKRGGARAHQVRRSMLMSCIVVMALLVGFSIGVIYVTN